MRAWMTSTRTARRDLSIRGALLLGSGVLAGLPIAAPQELPARLLVPRQASVALGRTSPAPFECTTPTVFLAQGTPSQLYDSLYGSGSTTFAKIGPTSSWTYNGMGYDPTNRFLYGISMKGSGSKYPVGHLLKIDNAGSVADLGALSGDSYLSANGATNGAFGSSSHLWVTSPGDKNVDETDVSSTPPKILKKLTMSTTWDPKDFTFDDGFMWGLATVSSTTKVFRLNLSTGRISTYAAPAGITPSLFGGAWTYGNGNLGFNGNSTGDVYQVSVTNPSTTPTFKLVSTYTGPTTSSQDDAAACVPPNVDLALMQTGPATVAAGSTIAWTLKVSNNGPGNSSGYVMNDTVPTGVTAVASTSPGCEVSGNDVNCTEGELGKGKAATYIVTGSAPTTVGTCITNAATVTGNEKDPSPSNNTSSVKTCTTAAPSILEGVVSVTSDEEGDCATLTSGGVDCWGNGALGQLGNGQFYTTGNEGSAVPVQVVGVGGKGALTGVAGLASSGGNYCALLTSGEVDCWGFGQYGQLGNGQFYTTGNEGSAAPVQVEGVGGSGLLTGVVRLASGRGLWGFCALLTSGGVDCWGNDEFGQLGNGTYDRSAPYGSAVPDKVEGVGGTGTLTGISSLSDNYGTNCAILTSGGLDCWGAGWVGTGGFPTPVPVEGVGGKGTLTGVASLTASLGDATFVSLCATLTSGDVDCWGWGQDGELGNGVFYSFGDAAPVQVEGVGGTGVLTGVASLSDTGDGFCALLTSGGVDCWGAGTNGQLGNGGFSNSAVPVRVEGSGGTGTLAGVAGITGSWNGLTYCARLTSGGVDCWGSGEQGELGNGQFYATSPNGSAVPVEVEGAKGSGTLGHVAGLTVEDYDETSYCARLTSTAVDCWGSGQYGQLGDGNFYPTSPYGSAVPVEVKAAQATA
jgi:uncharacterized repeat protein (TIGR01451 family)